AAERKKPNIRLAIGRVALELSEYRAAVEALRGLEKDLPLVRDEIRTWYAEAAAHAGPHDEAAKILEASPKVRDLIRAAEAHERANKLPAARLTIDKAIKRAEKTRRGSDEEIAHAVRARIAEKMGKSGVAIAVGDWRWIAQHGDDAARVREALTGLDRVKGPLTLTERLDALGRSCRADNVDATVAELDELAKKHLDKKVEIALARARAFNNSRDWQKTREAFEAVAKLPSAFIPEAQYYAARAAIRTGDLKWALETLNGLMAKYPTHFYAERALHRKAVVLLQLGRYEEAATAFGQYYTRYAKGEYAADARYGQAVALLSGGKDKKARPLLSALRKSPEHEQDAASLQHLEALAAFRSGDEKTAKRLWIDLAEKQPLTWPGMAAHARLAKMGHTPLPPLMADAPQGSPARIGVSLPPGPELLRSVGLDLAAEDRLAAMEQEAARAYPGRESEALCEMYGLLSCASRRHYVGTRAVSLAQLMRAPQPADRWQWSCVYPGPYSELVSEEEKRYQLPSGLVYAVMRRESAFKPAALSPVGARGLMQLMPETARRAAAELAIDTDLREIERPDLNLRLGAYYLGKLMKSFSGSLPLAVAAYNAGPHAVGRWVNGDRDSDLWVARIPYDETRHYVARVLGDLARYQYLSGGSAAVTPLALELPTTIAVGDDAY
ncbi:MAG TPA: transglycosylase SLT domain-containing protein, partial [Polyangiaceae bacterium]|nr:transglycosylase SLT domain-containing protein [Polyangiaceae bacterium]